MSPAQEPCLLLSCRPIYALGAYLASRCWKYRTRA